ncbi:hypothetical protein HDV04_000060 [Boothiomyces sp. JEL0838]|nr:hypothetical protein HDV04_000060 [Boothiomyces sp. JEL0838]
MLGKWFLNLVGKDKVRAHQTIIAVAPVTIYLTYMLYKRIILGEEPPKLPK